MSNLLRTNLEQHRQEFLELAKQNELTIRLLVIPPGQPAGELPAAPRGQRLLAGDCQFWLFGDEPPTAGRSTSSIWREQAAAAARLIESAPDLLIPPLAGSSWGRWADLLFVLCWQDIPHSGLPAVRRHCWDGHCTCPPEQLELLRKALGEHWMPGASAERWYADIPQAAAVSAQACLVLLHLLDQQQHEQEPPAQAQKQPPAKQRTGRRASPEAEQAADQRLLEAWESKQYNTYAQLAQATGQKRLSVKHAIGRARKRRQRKK